MHAGTDKRGLFRFCGRHPKNTGSCSVVQDSTARQSATQRNTAQHSATQRNKPETNPYNKNLERTVT